MKKNLNESKILHLLSNFDVKIKRTSLFVCLVFLLMTVHSYAQETKISLDMKEVSLETLIDEIESKTTFKFIYKISDVDPERIVSVKAEAEEITSILERIFANTGIRYTVMGKQIFLTPSDSSGEDTKEQIRVGGKVTDEDGLSLPGATVLIKGTYKGITTDKEGNYAIKVPGPPTILVFSFVGFKNQEITVGVQTTIDVTMEQSATELEEVTINAGYYTVKEREKTGNISRIDAKEIEKQPVSNPLQALQGRTTGVYIQQLSGLPGDNFRVRIRGQNSIGGSSRNYPLYIVDGVPYPSSPIGSTAFPRPTFSISPLNSINPNDIESIEILKDADATAIYGSRGANGVILITTKKAKIGKTSVQINVSSGVGEVANRMDLLNTKQYIELRKEALVNGGFDPDNFPVAFHSFLPDLYLWSDTSRYTDWQDELIGNPAYFTNIKGSFSGGNEKTQFLISASYQGRTYVFPGNNRYDRGSGHISINHASTDNKFNLKLSSTYTTDKNNAPETDLTPQAIGLPPNAPALYDDLGNINWEAGFNNPIAILEENSESITSNLISNLILSYQLIDELNLSTNIGYSILRLDEVGIRPLSSMDPAREETSGISFFSEAKTNTLIVEPNITYNKEIGNGKFQFLLGATFQQTKSQNKALTALDFPTDGLLRNPGSAGRLLNNPSNFSEYRYNAVFARLNYKLRETYILNLTARRDGSSRFGPNKQFSNFGAIGVGWIFSEENFIKKGLPFLSFGKLRTSYGSTGSDQIGDYQYLDSYRSTSGQYQDNPGLIPSRLFNSDFQWEEVLKFEAGIELGLFKDRVRLEISHYRNRSSNQLIGFSLSSVTGFTSVTGNFPATVENTGWEFLLNTSNIQSHNFKWNTSINLTIPRNELIEFPEIETSSFFPRIAVGRPLSTSFVANYIGVDTETGIYVFEDLNGDGNPVYQPSKPDDFAHLAERSQSYYGGILNTIEYKDLRLDFLFQFVKQTGLSYLQAFPDPGSSLHNQPTVVLDRWQKPGDVTNIQLVAFNPQTSAGYQSIRNSNRNIVDASFIRLKNVSLSYTLSSSNLNKKLGLNSIRFFIQGQNIFTITNFLGLDPETTTTGSLPPLRTITMGLDLSF